MNQKKLEELKNILHKMANVAHLKTSLVMICDLPPRRKENFKKYASLEQQLFLQINKIITNQPTI